MGLNEYERNHNRILRKLGAECTVLLKKDGNFPLAGSSDIALYGNGARNTIKGGTGSGEVNSRFFVSVEKGLERAGFRILTNDWLDKYDEIYSKAKEKFYADLRKEAREMHTQAMWIGMGRIMAEPEYDIPIEADCKTAIYVLSRISGEGSDREAVKGDIMLTETELRDIAICNDKYENFMLVLNTGGVVDISEIRFVKNILVLSQLGVKTGDTLADIILGRSNPSGKLTTTWTSWNSYPKIGDFGDRDDTKYKEGIYVGYRYFDSIGEMQSYPFGFGLSYTSFELKDPVISLEADVVQVSVDVHNTGAYTGKEAVQLYVSIPEGKLDEPYQVLAGFTKTREIFPGEHDKAEVIFSIKDIAPFSEADSAYILEPGDYILRLGTDSQNAKVIGCVRIGEEIIVRKVNSVVDKPDFTDWKPEEKIDAIGSMSESKDYKVLELDPSIIQTEEIDYERSYDIDEKLEELSDADLIKITLGAFDPKSSIASIVGNAGFTVAGAAGQTALGYEDKGIPSIVMADGPAGLRLSKHYTVDEKGVHIVGESALPDSIKELMPKAVTKIMSVTAYRPKKGAEIHHQYATAIPIGTAIAQSFNVELAEKCGDIVGEEMEMFGVHLWLAPALNIHRNIKCGRNFEYFSEDPLVSGLMAAAITNGVQKHKGCGTTIKHFCANNQEFNRTQNNSVMSERALREIYLRGFEICIRESQPKAVMTSYNLLNGVHTSHSRKLTEDVLRSEFGLRGIVMTDWVINGYGSLHNCKYPVANAPSVIMAGADVFMPGSKGDFDDMTKALKKGELTRNQLLISATRLVAMAVELTEDNPGTRHQL